MSSFYVKCYVPDFGKVIRVYLDNNQDSCSFISANLISNLDPSAIQMDENGEYACLDLIFRTRDGEECIKNVAFDVIDTDGNEFIDSYKGPIFMLLHFCDEKKLHLLHSKD